MPRHNLEVIKLLIIAIETLKTVILNALDPFPNFGRKVSNYDILFIFKTYPLDWSK